MRVTDPACLYVQAIIIETKNSFICDGMFEKLRKTGRQEEIKWTSQIC